MSVHSIAAQSIVTKESSPSLSPNKTPPSVLFKQTLHHIGLSSSLEESDEDTTIGPQSARERVHHLPNRIRTPSPVDFEELVILRKERSQEQLSPYYSALQEQFSFKQTNQTELSDLLSVSSDQQHLYDEFLREDIVFEPHMNSYGLSGTWTLLREAVPIAIYKSQDYGRGGFRRHLSQSLSCCAGKDGILDTSAITNELIVGNLSKLGHAPLAISFNSARLRLFGDEVTDQHLETGCLQKYLSNTQTLFSLNLKKGSSLRESLQISLDNFQEIALIDLRFLNTDRHAKNLLYSEEQHMLYPIDHGLTLPSECLSSACLCWMNFQEAHLNFTAQSMEQIRQLEFERDAATIKHRFPNYPIYSLETMSLCYYLLKKGASAGLTPFQIGLFLIPHEFLSSLLRSYYEKARASQPNTPQHVFQSVTQQLDHQIARLKTIILADRQKPLAHSIQSLQDALRDC